jgi:hypothetical protein
MSGIQQRSEMQPKGSSHLFHNNSSNTVDQLSVVVGWCIREVGVNGLVHCVSYSLSPLDQFENE